MGSFITFRVNAIEAPERVTATRPALDPENYEIFSLGRVALCSGVPLHPCDFLRCLVCTAQRLTTKDDKKAKCAWRSLSHFCLTIIVAIPSSGSRSAPYQVAYPSPFLSAYSLAGSRLLTTKKSWMFSAIPRSVSRRESSLNAELMHPETPCLMTTRSSCLQPGPLYGKGIGTPKREQQMPQHVKTNSASVPIE